jgi:hypothetical protein
MTAAINIANGWKHIACQIAFLMRHWKSAGELH